MKIETKPKYLKWRWNNSECKWKCICIDDHNILDFGYLTSMEMHVFLIAPNKV